MFLFKETARQKDWSVFRKVHSFSPIAENHESGLMFQNILFESTENCSGTLYSCLKMFVDLWLFSCSNYGLHLFFYKYINRSRFICHLDAWSPQNILYMVKMLWGDFTKNELPLLIVCLFAHATVFVLFSVRFTTGTMQIRFHAKLIFHRSNFWFTKEYVYRGKNDD